VSAPLAQRLAGWCAAAAILTGVAGAQTTRRGTASPSARGTFSLRGFGDAGLEMFQAADSFKTVFGTSTGILVGGGVDVLAPRGVFAQVRASRFRRTGARAFVFNGQVFALGVPDTVSIIPIEFTGGYRLRGHGWPLVPFVGGGVGRHRYVETSPGADRAESASQTFTGYHVLGGVELPIWRWLGAVGEVQWTSVPNALGTDPNSLSRSFNETNLGGVTARVKVVVGR